MNDYSIFDIVGPIMIGPSSSHTAGAARLSKMARSIAGENIKSVKFLLHGSFAKTYKGHGTDKALVAGILGLKPFDSELKDSFKIAKEQEIEFTFEEVEMDGAHPNTARIIVTKKDGSITSVTGSSIGGGNIKITNIDGIPVDFNGNKPTIITKHVDTPGVITRISEILYKENINIANMSVFQKSKGHEAVMVIEADSPIDKGIKKDIMALDFVVEAKVINPMNNL